MNLVESLETLTGRKFVEVESERGFLVDRLERVGALEVDRHVGVGGFSNSDLGLYIHPFRSRFPEGLMVVSQHLHSLGRKGQVELRHFRSRKEVGLCCKRATSQRQTY